MQKTKQCAGCGAQMGARSRVCPACGRGSLFGLLGPLFVLGVLLLAIGIVSGLIPLAPIQRAVMGAPDDTVEVVRPARPPVPKAATRRPRAPRREVRGTESVALDQLDSAAVKAAVPGLVTGPCLAMGTSADQMVRSDSQHEASPTGIPCEHEKNGMRDTGAGTGGEPAASSPAPMPGLQVEPVDTPLVEPLAF